MNQAYFERWTELAKKAQEPLQALIELNVKTLQEFHLNPEEFTQIKKPEEYVEKLFNIGIKNMHVATKHLEKTFKILEEGMLTTIQEVRKADNKAAASHAK